MLNNFESWSNTQNKNTGFDVPKIGNNNEILLLSVER